MKKVVIIDDEKDARDLLKHYISAQHGLSVVGEAADGYTAVDTINRLKPDTIFLDIQMPGLNGFEVLTRLDEVPEVIFSTAYDQYAIKAFELHAIDYLIKPYGKKRFENTLGRIINQQESIIPLAEELLLKDRRYPDKVILHKGTRKLMINVSDLHYGTAFGDYTKLYTRNEEYLSTKGISELIELLNPKSFLRTHRSHFVNIDTVKELKKENRYHFFILDNGARLKISDTYLTKVKKMIF